MSKILLIDDSPTALEAVGVMLIEAGHSVVATGQPAEALRLALDGELDLVITDIYMPDQDGLELIRKMRKARPELPIIAISGKSEPLNMLKVALLLGAREAIEKPVSRETLLGAVRAATGQVEGADR